MCGFLVQVWLGVTLFVAGQNIGLSIEVDFVHLALQCGCSEGGACVANQKKLKTFVAARLDGGESAGSSERII